MQGEEARDAAAPIESSSEALNENPKASMSRTATEDASSVATSTPSTRVSDEKEKPTVATSHLPEEPEDAIQALETCTDEPEQPEPSQSQPETFDPTPEGSRDTPKTVPPERIREEPSDAPSISSEDTEELTAAINARRNRSARKGAARKPFLNGEPKDALQVNPLFHPALGRTSPAGDATTEEVASRLGLSSADIEICQRLDLEYERALEEREVGYNARYQSVRQTACFSITFMVLYLTTGTMFFTRVAGWEVHDALFFSIYTMTTVGYGIANSIPDQEHFQIFVIFYIFIGIATLTIMVAQVYQCIALEAARAQHDRDRDHMTKKSSHHRSLRPTRQTMPSSLHFEAQPTPLERILEDATRYYERTRAFLRETQLGRGISSTFPFAGLILVGAIVVGPIEGWGVVESIYFSCVSLTTVGYGEYVPQNRISVYFCIFWLPFSVGFMSLYLSNVASFYIRLSDQNIQRIERQLRRRIRRAKEKVTIELQQQHASMAELGTDDVDQVAKKPRMRPISGFEMVADEDDDDSVRSSGPFAPQPADAANDSRRQQILANSNSDSTSSRQDGSTMQTMRDVLRTIRRSVQQTVEEFEDEDAVLPGERSRSISSNVQPSESDFLSIRSSQSLTSHHSRRGSPRRKPTFALRVLVQERIAEIIATDIAGFQSHIDIKDNTLSVTIESLKETADKWLVPRRARKAFRAVAFEALYFVGERGLITRGADALFDLSPLEFHGLFAPLLAAMGDAETMEGWLASTDVLANADLRRDGTQPFFSSAFPVASDGHKITEEQIAERFAADRLRYVTGEIKE
jgi:hypothetical protein